MSESLLSKQRREQGQLPIVMPAAEPVQLVDREVINSSYVAFADHRMRSWPKWLTSIPGLQPGDPVLVRGEPLPPLRLEPFRFMLVAAKSYYAQFDSSGNIVRATFDAEVAREDKNLKECAESILVVLLPTEAVYARCTWKTAKCGALHSAAEALAACQRPEWAKLSADHATSFAIPEPRARFTATVTTTKRTSAGGFGYFVAEASIKPATAGDLQLLAELSQREGAAQSVADMQAAHAKRLGVIQSKVV